MRKLFLILTILLLAAVSYAGPYEESRKAGIDAFNKGNYEYALKCFQSVLKIAPANNDLAEWIGKCKKKINDSPNSTRSSAKRSDSYYIEQAKKCVLLNDIAKAESYLDRVDNRESVDYCLLKGDILYLYKFAEYGHGWRNYYNHAAYLGNSEAEVKSHSLVVDSKAICTHTSNPKTEAEHLAHKADSLIPRSWSDQTREFEESFNLYLKSAEMGHPTAQLNVGRFYMKGYGVRRNYQEAFAWFTKAANSNSSVQVEAKCILAWFYFNGICTIKNEAKAYELIKIQKYGYSGTNNGLCNEFGIGTNVNKPKALYLYRNNINYKPSSYPLEEFYEVAMERYCYLTCIEQMEDTLPKNGKLCYEIALGMARLYNNNYTKKEHKVRYKEESLKLYNNAYNIGVDDNDTKVQLANYLKENKEYDKAISLYESASSDNKYACYNLGEIYEKGYGVPRNFSKAKDWYLKAKEMGHYSANEALKRLSKKGY